MKRLRGSEVVPREKEPSLVRGGKKKTTKVAQNVLKHILVSVFLKADEI